MGYKKVSIMKNVIRYDYLRKVKLGKQKFILIVPGLHDGEQLILRLINEIASSQEQYIFKPHPRAVSEFIHKYKLNNLKTVSYTHLTLPTKRIV